MNYGMDYQGESGGGFNYGGGASHNNHQNAATGGGGYYSSQPGSSGSGSGGYSMYLQDGGGMNSGGKVRRWYDDQHITPTTIRMLLKARPEPDDGVGDSSGAGGGVNMQLEDGRVLSKVKLVAATRAVDETSTALLYDVEDGTGFLQVKQWIEDHECTASTELRIDAMKEHQYIKIIGKLKSYEGNVMIVADSVRRVQDANQITHHFLEVVYAGEQWKKKMAAQKMAAIPGSGMQPMSFTGHAPLQATSYNNLNSNNNGGTYNRGTGGPGMDGGLSNIIVDYIRVHSKGNERGCSIVNCIQELVPGGRFTERQIRAAVEDLSIEGRIFSTIDDDHYMNAGY